MQCAETRNCGSKPVCKQNQSASWLSGWLFRGSSSWNSSGCFLFYPVPPPSSSSAMSAAVHPLTSHMMNPYPRPTLNGVAHTMAGPSVIAQASPVTTRKRKRAHQYTVSYSEVQEVDSDGRLREVIVIEDTPPPPTISPATTHNGAYSASYQPPTLAPIRTRARAAAEAQAMSSSSSSVLTAPAPKKRKRDHQEEVRAPPAKKLAAAGQQAVAVSNSAPWKQAGQLVTADVCLNPLSFS
jgi:dual-specificity kinase